MKKTPLYEVTICPDGFDGNVSVYLISEPTADNVVTILKALAAEAMYAGDPDEDYDGYEQDTAAECVIFLAGCHEMVERMPAYGGWDEQVIRCAGTRVGTIRCRELVAWKA